MPAIPYKNANGVSVPSVTTVIGRYDNKQALIYAANKVGLQGQTLKEAWYDGAATIGTAVHRLIELGVPLPTTTKQWNNLFAQLTEGERLILKSGMKPQIKKSFTGYHAWKQNNKLRIAKKEISLVSEEYGFGGTMDACVIGNRRAVLDYKTSKGIYPGYKVQVAAYRLLWNENFPKKRITGGGHILQIDKLTGGFQHWHSNDLDPYEKVFLSWLTAAHTEREFELYLK